MHGTDGILALLQDIKEILYGIVWLILGGILMLAGVFLTPTTGLPGLLGLFLILIGICLVIGGILYARHGHNHNEVIEHPDETVPHD